MTKERADAALVLGDGMFGFHRVRIAELAVKHRLPTMHRSWGMVESGGLVFYGPSTPELFRQAAAYVDKS